MRHRAVEPVVHPVRPADGVLGPAHLRNPCRPGVAAALPPAGMDRHAALRLHRRGRELVPDPGVRLRDRGGLRILPGILRADESAARAHASPPSVTGARAGVAQDPAIPRRRRHRPGARPPAAFQRPLRSRRRPGGPLSQGACEPSAGQRRALLRRLLVPGLPGPEGAVRRLRQAPALHRMRPLGSERAPHGRLHGSGHPTIPDMDRPRAAALPA